jgi:hypothetical protein
MDITRTYAKQLRRELTKEERRLWYLLRSRRFENYKFRRQHPVDHYILVSPAVRLIWLLNWMAGNMMKSRNTIVKERAGLTRKAGMSFDFGTTNSGITKKRC